MRKQFPVLLILLLILTIGAPAIQAQDGERLQVVGSFSILTDVVANVAGDAADVTSLMPRFSNPHAYTPTPQDLVTLAEADIVFTVGANFEEGLLEAITNAGDTANLAAVSSCVQILPFGGADDHAMDEHDEHDEHEEGDDHADDEHDEHEDGDEHEHADDEHADEDHDEHEHADDEHDEHEHDEHDGDHSAMAATCEGHYAELGLDEHDHPGSIEPLGMLYALDCGGHDHEEAEGEMHAHTHGACDSHTWTDPYNVMLWTLTIRDTLSSLDPANADVYAANAADYIAALEDLIDEIAPLMASIPEDSRKLVTNHLAYNYFAQRFDLTMVGTVIPGASSLAEPSAAEVAALIDGIREAGVPAIFAEMTANPELATQIAEETGVELLTLYTGTLSDADGPASTYIDYIRHSAQTIVQGLGE